MVNNIHLQKHAGIVCTALAAIIFYAGSAAGQGSTPSGSSPPAGQSNPFEWKPLPANAKQPSNDPRNFEGTWSSRGFLWQITELYGGPLPFNDKGRKVYDRRRAADKAGTPFVNASLLCRPVGPSMQFMVNPFNVHHTKSMIDFSFFLFHSQWTVYLDPTNAPPPGDYYMGRAIGHWDGDTLVVETHGFKQGLWLDLNGTPASKNAKLTHRIRKVHSDEWFLEIVYTLDDPTYYTRPWSWVTTAIWRPDQTMYAEYNCEMSIGSPSGSFVGGHIPEPED